MPEFLLHLDRHLFHFINQGIASSFFDILMPWLRNPLFWIPVYIFIVAFSLIRFKKQGVMIIIFILAAVGVADFTSATLIKQAIQRPRPCREKALSGNEIVRVPCGTGYSFPSTHATDHFAMSAFLIAVFNSRWRWIWFWALLWASLVGFAQIYVGLHYPFDVIGGAIFGVFIGWLFGFLHKKFEPQFYHA